MPTRLSSVAMLALLLGSLLTMTPRAGADASGSITPSGLTLSVSPIVDVGSEAQFVLTARSWSGPASALLRLVSRHHDFSGAMPWDVACRCFRLAAPLDRRVHQLEDAHAWALVRFDGGTARVTAAFAIRGLMPDGKRYAPGGAPLLASWVGDPYPARGQLEHFCAWVHAADGFGFPGIAVRFVIRYPKPDELFVRTNKEGLACAQRSIDGASSGIRVPIDIYAAHLHAAAVFTPRA